MKTANLFWMALTWFAVVASSARAGDTPRQAAPAGAEGSPAELAIGGCGGVYLLAEPGELTVDLEKRDRGSKGRRTELRAILAGPDRQVLQEVTLRDGGPSSPGKPGQTQRARLSTHVVRKGVYLLNITASQDRYGDAILWGFRTNCRRYLIETSRGHRDERHQEPLVLLNPKRPGDVCFLPRAAAFGIEVAGLPAGTEALSVFDDRNALVQTLRVESGGQASGTFAADPRRGALPWRLHLPSQQATVQIDGTTRWDRDDPYPNLSLWTPDAASWFPFHEYRWLLTPYRTLLYGRPGTQGEAAFRVQNNSDRPKTVTLRIEFPESPWPASVAAERITLRAKEARDVAVRYTVPSQGETRVCHLRATPIENPDFSTYSTLTVKSGVAPATRPLSIPLVLKPYCHENEQFGYVAGFPLESQLYFDVANRPWVRISRGAEVLRDGEWIAADLARAVKSSSPGLSARSIGMASTKIAFDRDGDVYLLGAAGRSGVLLHSRDGGKTFAAYRIPGREGQARDLDFEVFTGHNVPDGPPPILSYTHLGADPKRIWRRINALELYLPTKTDGRITFGEPVPISKQCIGIAMHSGSPSEVVSRGAKVHVVWAEATDPEVKVPGVPTFVATYDRSTKTLGKPALVAYGPPANDIHNTPSITLDSQGYLHVLAGTHGQPFPYCRSLKPDDAHAGWTEPTTTGEGEKEKLSQTYIGMVCGPDDSLHLAYRLWQRGKEPFPASHYATLAYQRKRPGKPWEPPRVLIVPPFSEYSVFYHRLTIDRKGRLFLSYDYWSTYWFYRTDHPGSRRAVLLSPDGGDTWKLAENEDLVRP